MAYGYFKVMSEGGYVGTYFAQNAKTAIANAAADQNTTASSFRKSQPAIQLKGLVATMIKDAKGRPV